MLPSCPDPSLLAAYADRALPAAERESLEGHLASCPSCLGEALDLSRVLATPVRIPRAWAAAAVLAAACLLLPLRRGAPDPSPPVRSSLSTLNLPGGGRMAAGAGAELRSTGPSSAELRRGRIWLDAGDAPVSVSFPGGEVRARDAELVLELEGPTPRAGWLPEAWAGECRISLLCRRGACRVLWEGEESSLEAGQGLRATAGARPVRRAVPPAEMEEAVGWTWDGGTTPAPETLAARAAGMSPRVADGVLSLSVPGFGSLDLGRPPPGDYRLEVDLRPRRAGGDLGLAFPARDRFPYWMPSATGVPLPAGAWTRLAVERRSGRVRLWRNGILEAVLESAEADALLPASSTAALGIWGGEIDLRGLRWRT